MSWSVSAIGKAGAVAQKLAADFAKIKCSEPEQSIKNCVVAAVAAALDTFPQNYAVRVEASGSQSCPDFSKAPDEKVNNLSVKIDPVYGFVE